jgi:hypothetical protein
VGKKQLAIGNQQSAFSKTFASRGTEQVMDWASKWVEQAFRPAVKMLFIFGFSH